MKPQLLVVPILLVLLMFAGHVFAAAQVVVDGRPKAAVYTEDKGLTPGQKAAMAEARAWLVTALEQSTGAKLTESADTPPASGPAIVLTTAKARPDLAAKVNLKLNVEDASAVIVDSDRVYLLGSNPFAVRFAVAQALRDLGFRYYAPSPKWHVVPKLSTVEIKPAAADAPDVASRAVWYAYGQQDKKLMEDYRAWAFGNRMTLRGRVQTGHSYGNIINRNAKEFEAHPEYFALLEDGKRDKTRSVLARKFCYSNPGLIELVANDRIRLLEEQRKLNPEEYMVSVDPSDGQGTCVCENCVKLGTTTDRVFHLANQVAVRLRAKYPDAWVGLYAYSSHRLPPTIKLEPNVYVQVALAFNRTEYSLPELVELWSQKAGAIGLREYYGVEAWDWGLPGRMRGGKVGYHRQWIPYYTQRKLNAINAETNSNWGGQSLGLFVAAELMWDNKADVDGLMNRYHSDLFGKAAAPARALSDKFESGQPLNPQTLGAMFRDLKAAYQADDSPSVRARIVDLMAYLIYVETYRRFELTADTQPTRNDVYYKSLDQLMNFAWRVRDRDVIHTYALARRLCNSLPLTDKRPEFNLENKSGVVWKRGELYTDPQIVEMFDQTFKEIESDQGPYTTFSRFFEQARLPQNKGAMSRLHTSQEPGQTRLRGTTTGYLVPSGKQSVTLGVKAENKPVTLRVYARGEEVLQESEVKTNNAFTNLTIDLPKAGEYRFELTGEMVIQVAPGTPLMLEASPGKPAWIDYSGPHYFYVPKSVKVIYVDAEPRLSIYIPGQEKRLDIGPADRVPGKSYCAIPVPEGAAGKLWSTDTSTRGRVMFLNIPPLMSLDPSVFFIPREVAEQDSLTTAK